MQRSAILTSILLIATVLGGVLTGTAMAERTPTSMCGLQSPEGVDFQKALLLSGAWERWATRPLPGPHRGARDLPRTFVKVTVHPVRFYTGTQGVDLDAVDSGIAILNEKVADTGLTFYRHEVRTLDDDQFAMFHLDGGEMNALINTDSVPGTMNVYYVPYFFSPDDWVAGVSTLPYSGGTMGIVIGNVSAAGGVLAHEAGHYHGLSHPFDWGAHGDECAEGTDCRFQADLICETPADPGIGGWGNFADGGYCSSCTPYSHSFDYSTCEMTDSDWDRDNVDCDDVGADCEGACMDSEDDVGYRHPYRPLGNNIMSYYGCGDQTFVSEQLAIMLSVSENILFDHVVVDYDCNGNDIPDQFEISSPIHEASDCDGNGIIDECDIASSPALDCDEDGRIDTCQIAEDPALYDCDSSGQLDTCELTDDPTLDCNQDGEYDPCQMILGELTDCDANGLPDVCDLEDDDTLDCDGDGLFDACEITDGIETDCNGNGIPDACDVADDATLDCDGDGVADSCQIEGDADLDCDGDGNLDTCQLLDAGTSADCDGDGLIDVCAIAEGLVVDCDANDVPDSCEDDLPDEAIVVVDLDGDVESQLGAALSTWQDLVVMGVPGDDLSMPNAGSVLVWRMSVLGPTFEATLVADEVGSYDFFGAAVSAGDGIIAVGAPLDNAMGTNSGAVTVFEHDADAGTWTSAAELYPSDGDVDDEFGSSVLVHGAQVIVGAPYAFSSDEHWTGQVYVYEDTGAGWEEVQRLAPDTGDSDDWYGYAMAGDGDTLVIGAPATDSTVLHGGAIHIYEWSNDMWSLTQTIASPLSIVHGHFGNSLSVDDDRIVVGTPGAGDLGMADAGAIYVYTKGGDGVWTGSEAIMASDARAGDWFGESVALAGSRLIVGAPHYDWGNNGVPLYANSGAVYVFAEDEDGNWIEEAPIGLPDLGSSPISAEYGTSMAMIAGRAVVGAPAWALQPDGDPVGLSIITVFSDCDGDGQLDGCQVEDDPSIDCDGDGAVDTCAIAQGFVEDCDGNGTPDSCDFDAGGDANGDGILDACEGSGSPPGDCNLGTKDLLGLLYNWDLTTPAYDYDDDGTVGLGDLIMLAANWGTCL